MGGGAGYALSPALEGRLTKVETQQQSTDRRLDVIDKRFDAVDTKLDKQTDKLDRIIEMVYKK
jgi:hypothetical protein